jgi:hypothetical protein
MQEVALHAPSKPRRFPCESIPAKSKQQIISDPIEASHIDTQCNSERIVDLFSTDASFFP